jgi:alpha-ribazole phosphatase
VSTPQQQPLPQRRLWLVRHARPLVTPGICYGALDVPADAAATRTAAEQLAAALPHGVPVWHSPLQRCEQLALDLIALRPDLTSKPDARLREMDFGNWEGQSWDAIGKARVDAWTADFCGHAPGGGESLAQMLERVQSALEACGAMHGVIAHAGEKTEDTATGAASDIVWITHAGVARCVAWLQAHGSNGAEPTAEHWPVAAPAWGTWDLRLLTKNPGRA